MKALLLISCLALVGCRSVTVDLATMPGEDRIAREDGINCRITPDVGPRAEPLFPSNAINDQIHFETGRIWERVFVGGPNAPATLELVSTKFTENIAGGGFTIRDTYDVYAYLRIGEKVWPLYATGTRASAMHAPSTRRQAVELAVVDIAHQAKAIMRSVLLSPTTP